MEMKFFGLIETKLFNFIRIFINGGGGGGGVGGGSIGPPEPRLDPPLLYVVSCRVQRFFTILDMQRSR